MTTGGDDFWGLGFDPLPGDPEAIKSLELDAREFGRRMTEQADVLRRLAHRDGWQGEAADVFAQHLETLPRDLDKIGSAFLNLSGAIGNYHDRFLLERTRAKELEQRAVAARQKLNSAQFAYDAPVISAPDNCPPPPDRGPLDAAEDELGVILREAHGFAERFDCSPEVQNLARSIRDFARVAPDEPRWNIIRRWAGDVFTLTPIGAAINSAHELINHYAEFFNDLASVLSDISGSLGILSLPLLFFPPLGTTAAVAALAAAAGSTTMKTSLYVGHARDANGNLYISGGTLVRSYVDLGLNAGGVAGGAAAERAAKLAKGEATTFGKEVGKAFSAKNLNLDPFRDAAGLLRAEGRAKGTGIVVGKTLKTFKATYPGHLYNTGGVGLTAFGPLTTALAPNNFFGWQSPRSLWTDLPSLVTDASNQPDLGLRITSADAPPPTPRLGRSTPPSEPVMKD